MKNPIIEQHLLECATVPKYLFPLCLLCQNVYSQNVYSFGKNELMMKSLYSIFYGVQISPYPTIPHKDA